METQLIEPAQAKINLFLHVTGKRDDGYHTLDSLVCFATCGDVIRARPADDGTLTLAITGPMAAHLEDASAKDNLVMRAATLLRERFGIAQGAELILEKNLPVASGIGGGSADAAATLRVLCKLWGINARPADLAPLALDLGADVPVCLDGGTVLMQGIGEKLNPLAPLPGFSMVLVNPGKAVSTPAIFAARDGDFTDANLWPTDQGFADVTTLADALRDCRNDLTLPAVTLLPEICDVLDALARADGCLLARMSGSGATCFGLYPDAQMAANAATAIATANPDWWVNDCKIASPAV
ncbi:4-(cytidine 5'-diphospho)-2-C-methyl-D-erythritol kinase [Thalassospira marina]|uniref:4-diphosphocytidyl-2-C-methyl-D-erythritol kinase n=1 Tax=Thalassospira marina TaxID=2048283 RepID=A0A2N3KU24_9PROT|nr:4-(cytidine 5'-diphospho)-2-C-methyl-D-erythritol kinase [Thalassospira marina]PKR54042.1 4-(cytidine 5'-diphospho)-2-C-methyl-D-erythritol kinase [Thalassospira marina]